MLHGGCYALPLRNVKSFPAALSYRYPTFKWFQCFDLSNTLELKAKIAAGRSKTDLQGSRANQTSVVGCVDGHRYLPLSEWWLMHHSQKIHDEYASNWWHESCSDISAKPNLRIVPSLKVHTWSSLIKKSLSACRIVSSKTNLKGAFLVTHKYH